MSDDLEDYRAGPLLGHDIELLALRPGDVLLCRPRSALGEAQIDKIHRQLNVMAGENPSIRILMVPNTWDIGVGRFEGDDEAIKGLRNLIHDFSS